MNSFNGYVSQEIMQHGSFIIGDVYKQKSHAFFLELCVILINGKVSTV